MKKFLDECSVDANAFTAAILAQCSSLNFLRKAMLGGFLSRWAGQLVISAKHQFVALWSQSVRLHLWRGDCNVMFIGKEFRSLKGWDGFCTQALVGRFPTTGDMSSCDGQQELRRKPQDTTPLEFRVLEFLAEGVQFFRICEVRHQENLSNVLFYIQDADQRLRNELSGMVQFVPKDVEEERVRRHSEDPVSVLGPCFRGSDGDVAVDRRGGETRNGGWELVWTLQRLGKHVTQRGLGSSVQVEVGTHCGVAQFHGPQDSLRFLRFSCETEQAVPWVSQRIV